jgi:hypothetical protein
MGRVQRVEIAIMRERGLTETTDEIRREAYRFLAMLDAVIECHPVWRDWIKADQDQPPDA